MSEQAQSKQRKKPATRLMPDALKAMNRLHKQLDGLGDEEAIAALRYHANLRGFDLVPTGNGDE